MYVEIENFDPLDGTTPSNYTFNAYLKALPIIFGTDWNITYYSNSSTQKGGHIGTNDDELYLQINGTSGKEMILNITDAFFMTSQ